MIIDKMREIIKSQGISEKSLYLSVFIIVIALLSFGLGKLSVLYEYEYPVKIEGVSGQNFLIEETTYTDVEKGEGLSQSGLLIGSKNGNKYHYPWCSGAQRIKEENKIWFSSKEEAEANGYTPAANCPGL